MIRRFKYWNKWRKKFPTAYSKWAKFLVLIGLSKPHTFRLLIFTDTCAAATIALNNLTEILRQTTPEKKAEESKEVGSDEVSKV